VRSLDVSGYDIIISNSHAVAKGIRKRPGQLHVSYCLSPMRYAWDLREQYLRESGNDRGLRGILARQLLDALKRWDRSNSRDVDVFATLSHYIAERIRRAYDRDSIVVYPPVDTDYFTPGDGAREDYYVTSSRFVPYKRVDLIARAFSEMPDRRLLVIGHGPDVEKVRAAAGPNVTLAGHLPRPQLRDALRSARAFLFAAEEDFGIAPVEAQACGTPVIAFGRGGATETVVSTGDPAHQTGVLFSEQTTDSIREAVVRFESRSFSADACRRNAERFERARFQKEFGDLVDAAWRRHTAQQP
jgi:glycosyltransferase involved in cell wall biosynthesis